MNNRKNIIFRTASILSLVVGGLAFLAGAINLAMIDPEWDTFYAVLAYEVFIVLSSIALVALGSMLCQKKNWTRKPLIMSLIILVGIMLLYTFVYIISVDPDVAYLYYFEIFLGICTIGLFITGLVLPDAPAQPYQQVPPPQPVVNQKEQQIELLKKLRDSGQLTEEEYKELLMKELSK